MKRSNETGAGLGPLEPMEGPDSPLPWFWLDARRSDPLRVARIQGTASGQQDDRLGPDQTLFSSVNRQSLNRLVVLTRPQPQAPNLLGAGQHAGHSPLESLEGANQAGARRGLLESMEGQTARFLALAGRRALCPAPGPENLRDGLATTRR